MNVQTVIAQKVTDNDEKARTWLDSLLTVDLPFTLTCKRVSSKEYYTMIGADMPDQQWKGQTVRAFIFTIGADEDEH